MVKTTKSGLFLRNKVAPKRRSIVRMRHKHHPSFGMLMPNRTIDAEKYRFGFNDKENDNELKGTGNSVDFGARRYDPRINNLISIDPLYFNYPNISGYTYVGDNPIHNIDPDGRSILPVNKDASTLLNVTFEYFGGDKFKTALSITDKNGVVRSNIVNAHANTMNSKEFSKFLKSSGINLKGDDLKSAYSLYVTLQSGKKTELAVFAKNKGASTRTPGDNGTRLVDGEGISTNENFKTFSYAFEKDNKTLDNLTEGKKYGILEYGPQMTNDPDLSHNGTLIIDATDENPKQTIKTFIQAIKVK